MERLRSAREFFVLLLKIDLALLAGLGTFVTVMDLQGSDLASAITRLRTPVALLVFAMGIAFLGVVLMTVYMGVEDPKIRGYHIALMVIPVALFHAVYVGWSFHAAGDYADRRSAEIGVERMMPVVKGAVDVWVDRIGEVPSADSLYSTEAGRRLRRSIGGQTTGPDTLVYEKQGEATYSIRFPGPDGEVGSGDDILRSVELVIERDTVTKVVPVPAGGSE